jgi:hypothetical protein
MPAFSCSQAARYIVCIRRVNETPEKSRSTALEMLTPLVAPAGVANSSCTAAAASPVRLNFLTSVLAAAFSWSSGANVDIRMSSGMSAVKAWDDSTMHRSSPAIRTNRVRHRPRKDSWSRSISSETPRVGTLASCPNRGRPVPDTRFSCGSDLAGDRWSQGHLTVIRQA